MEMHTSSPAFLIGLVLYIVGMVFNWRSDYQLISLRKKGETVYKIPQRGLFNYVSSPAPWPSTAGISGSSRNIPPAEKRCCLLFGSCNPAAAACLRSAPPRMASLRNTLRAPG
jgi:hypothetical protein